MTNAQNTQPAGNRITAAIDALEEADRDLFATSAPNADVEHFLTTALEGLATARTEVEAAITLAIIANRDGSNPVSWDAIGKALGISRQAAWERYSGVQVRPAE